MAAVAWIFFGRISSALSTGPDADIDEMIAKAQGEEIPEDVPDWLLAAAAGSLPAKMG